MDDGMGLWMMGGGMMMVPLLVAFIALALWAIQAGTRRPGDGAQQEHTDHAPRRPIEIAKERYARGDVFLDAGIDHRWMDLLF